MRVGVGLPTTFPGVSGKLVIDWAQSAEAQGLGSLGVLDRIAYDGYDPLAALAAASAVTSSIQLVTMIVVSPLRNTALLARQSVDVLLCPSASPGRGIGRGTALGTAQSYDAMTRTYAQLYTAYVVYCNRVGYEDGIGFWGGSRVVGPDGALLSEPAGADETILYHRLDKTALRRARIATPVLRDERHDVNDAENERIRRQQPRD